MKLKLGKWEDFNKHFPPREKTDLEKYAMPWISDSGNDFGLGDERTNRKKLDLYLQNKTEVLEEDGDFEFFLSGSWEESGYLIKWEKKTRLIYYYCKFQVSGPTKFFPHILTQTEVWRAMTQPDGMARKFLFDFLYPKYQAVTSDRIHTERGKEFWITILATANNKGLGIAVVDRDRIFTKPKEMSLRDFIEEVNTWKSGKENKEREMQIQFMFYDPSLLPEEN